MGAGGASNKQEVVEIVGDTACKVRDYTVDKFELSLLDKNIIMLTYYATQQTTCFGKPVPSPVWVSSLYIKRNNQWLNVFYQQTPAR
jgi:hypothetical protein